MTSYFCCSSLLPVFLTLLLLLSLSLGDLTKNELELREPEVTLKHVLRRVLHGELFRRHSGSKESRVERNTYQTEKEEEVVESLAKALSRSHLEAARGNSTQAMPFLGCGKWAFPETWDEKLEEMKQVVGKGRVHLAKEVPGEEVCVLLHASVDMVDILASDKDWKFSPIPNLFKIHQELLSYLLQDEPFSYARPTSTIDALKLKGQNETLEEKEGEGLELVVQFAPGSQVLQSEWDSLLSAWSYQKGASDTFQEHLVNAKYENNEGLVTTWEFLKTNAAVLKEQQSGDTKQDRCSLPSSSQVEFHPAGELTEYGPMSIGKVVDLSGWSQSGQSSIYCFVELVEVLSSHPDVLSLNIHRRPVLLNYDVRGLSQSGTAGNNPFSDVGLIGEGQVVGLADSGIDDKNCFFWDNSGYYSSQYTTRQSSGGTTVEWKRRKVIQYTAYADGEDAVAGHGTHVAGTLVGDSVNAHFARANGVAPGAKVAFYDIQKKNQAYLNMPGIASSMFPTLHSAGARVMSNSWGSSGADIYSEKSYEVDSYTYNNNDVLVVFAAGNSGADGSQSVFSPCASKNALCVGSIDVRNDRDDGTLAYSRVSYFSSQGPTGDGRIKPDVVGPGFKVVSALSGGSSGGDKFCGVYETFGTSMATPVVSGGALVLLDYFKNSWSGICTSGYSYCKSFEPSGYLLKALIIHSAQAVDSYSQSEFDTKTEISAHSLGSPPDSVQGYGAVNLNSVIPLSSKERSDQELYVADSYKMSGRSSATLVASVSSSARPLKITVAWYDMPSTVGNSYNLLMLNVDLKVTTPSGKVYYGNGVDGDSYNPQEQVYIAKPEKGDHTVEISNMGGTYVTVGMVVTCRGLVTRQLLTSGSRSSAAGLTLSSANPFGQETVQAEIDSAGASSLHTESLPLVNATSAGGAMVSAATPLFSDYKLVKSYTISHTLSALEKKLLKTFEVTDSSIELFSIELSLDAHFCSGSEAFIFAVLVEVPNGEVIQVGGYNEYSSLDRLWQRMSPVQWAATSVPADGGSFWKTTRYVVDLQVAQTGKFDVYIQLLHDSWQSTHYFGNVKLYFVDKATALSRSKTAQDGFFSGMSTAGAGLLIFFLGCAVVLSLALVLRKRRVLNAAAAADPDIKKKRGAKAKKTGRKSTHSIEDAPWSHLSGLLSDNSASSHDVENPLSSNNSRDNNVSADVSGDQNAAGEKHKRYRSARSNADV